MVILQVLNNYLVIDYIAASSTGYKIGIPLWLEASSHLRLLPMLVRGSRSFDSILHPIELQLSHSGVHGSDHHTAADPGGGGERCDPPPPRKIGNLHSFLQIMSKFLNKCMLCTMSPPPPNWGSGSTTMTTTIPSVDDLIREVSYGISSLRIRSSSMMFCFKSSIVVGAIGIWIVVKYSKETTGTLEVPI